MKIRKTIQSVILGSIFLLLSTVSLHAGFGVSPTNINSEFLKPGASFEQSFTLSRSDSLEKMTITVQPSLGEIAPWFTYKPGNTFIFEKGETTKEFKVIVNVPKDAKYQTYDGVIRITAAPSDQAVAGVSITQGVRLDAQLIVTEADHRELSILSIKALNSIEGKPIRLEIVGENKGNVDASPTIKLKVMNLLMEVLEEHEIANFGFVKPNQTDTLIAEFTSKLPTGEYFIEVTVLLDGKELRKERLVFNIENVPVKDTEEEKENWFISNIGSLTSFFNERPYILLIGLILLILLVLIYLLIRRMRKWKKLTKETTDSGWKILFKSKAHMKELLIFLIGFELIILSILFVFNSLGEKEIVIETKDVQGVQDTNVKPNLLYVFPNPNVQEYVVHTLPDLNSGILYTATEGETFKVVEETEDWYKVLVNENSYGWLHKSVVKEKAVEGK